MLSKNVTGTRTRRRMLRARLHDAIARQQPQTSLAQTIHSPGAVSWNCDGIAYLSGEVEPGDRRGRELGFPTANLGCEHLELDDGVWAGTLRVEGQEARLAAISIGRRATIYGHSGYRLAEIHVLDFSGDLYGKTVTVSLDKFLRNQRQFTSLPALVRQLARDIDSCRRWGARANYPFLSYVDEPFASASVK